MKGVLGVGNDSLYLQHISMKVRHNLIGMLGLAEYMSASLSLPSRGNKAWDILTQQDAEFLMALVQRWSFL